MLLLISPQGYNENNLYLKNLSDVFFNGNGGSIPGLNVLSDADKFAFLKLRAAEGHLPITCKIGNDSFRDKVELNQLLREPCNFQFKLEPRRGYRLATFEITKQ